MIDMLPVLFIGSIFILKKLRQFVENCHERAD
ncbi:hypothetical protein VITU102760_14205 [Vibrio tubiashii]|uniref:Uncharacterized protein n=1 Tax=Vibrio tubiashii ATCC 19109 TaxID=1051646 RepID=A0ABN0DAP4_9VIBR|nr:hypothetical protein VITU9109_21769 [Vibrio tubiashii ATCC 19109]